MSTVLQLSLRESRVLSEVKAHPENTDPTTSLITILVPYPHTIVTIVTIGMLIQSLKSAICLANHLLHLPEKESFTRVYALASRLTPLAVPSQRNPLNA